MYNINAEIGKRIHIYRKKQNLTLDGLSRIICKSKSTLSKYEKGEISIDVETLYHLADALHVHVEQLLVSPPETAAPDASENVPAFFQDISRFYSYIYDGRSKKIMRCIWDILSKVEINRHKLMMYMNFKDYEKYQLCETTYWGFIEHYDAVTNILLTNQDNPMEKASAHILASYLNSDSKWGLFNGFSSRPMMPVSSKMLFSRTILKEDESFVQLLKISKEDIRLFKLYNMYPVL